ncbi:MAG: T9SS type A sorting domain-containing protein [Lentimicrobium sp.]|nr:T9SS type A sorting domain-containing protein [Lentimicrobium sp.]
MNNTTRTHNSQAFYKNGLPNTLRITASGGLFSDETVIRFAEGTTPFFDNQSDAWKLLNDQANQLYTRAADNTKLAINCIPGPDQTPVVPLNYSVVTSGTYSLTTSGTESFDPGTPVVLLDLLANYRQDLRLMPEYQFTANEGDDENRFAIAFGTLTAELSAFEPVSIFSDGRTLSLYNPDQSSGLLQINDLSGKVIFEKNIIGESRNTFPLTLSPGIYIARFAGNGINVSKKIIIVNID